MRKHIFYRWNLLTEEEKKDIIRKTKILFDFCEKNPSKKVTFEQMNKIGLNHLYKFLVDDYNSESNHELEVDEIGCTCRF